MKRKRHSAEQIGRHLRDAEQLMGSGETVEQACKKLGISEQAYCRWKRDFGSMGVVQAKRLKDLEQENARLMRVVADMDLDNAMLEELAKGNF